MVRMAGAKPVLILLRRVGLILRADVMTLQGVQIVLLVQNDSPPCSILQKAGKEAGEVTSGDWFLDPDELASKFNSRTKAIIINTPNNPIGKVSGPSRCVRMTVFVLPHCFLFLLSQVFTKDELQVIADLCIKHDTLCFSDEVYEWLIYRGHRHIKIGTVVVHVSMLVYFWSFVLREPSIFISPV